MLTKRLVVYVPGIGMKPKMWDPLISRLKQDLSKDPDFGESVWKGFDHGCGYLSLGSAKTRAGRLRDWLDAEWDAVGGYDEIIFIGHSMSGLLLRQAYLLATDKYPEEPNSEWPNKVSRIILLAEINRGFDIEKRVGVGKLPIGRICDWSTRILGWLWLGNRLLARDFLSGSNFITDLRLRWIAHMRELPGNQRPMVIQILGNRDGIVSREDSVDLEQFPNAYHIKVLDVGHADLPFLNKGPHPEHRFRIIRDAILGKVSALEPLTDKMRSLQGKAQVVFILHGIRAANYNQWVSNLAKLIRQELPGAEVVEPGYKRLSALEFAIPFLHRKSIRLFQDQYCAYFASNPGAQFHFVGHSNGTYILGQSLLALTGMRFDNVMLAGSVLPPDFPWYRLIKTRGQIKAVRSDQATKDWPVGILCSALTGLGRSDIGTGGYTGFSWKDNNIRQYAFHDGGHGAALMDNKLPNIVDFLLHGTNAPAPASLAGEIGSFSLLSRLSPSLFKVFVGIFISLAIYGFIFGEISILVGLFLFLVILGGIFYYI